MHENVLVLIACVTLRARPRQIYTYKHTFARIFGVDTCVHVVYMWCIVCTCDTTRAIDPYQHQA